MQQPNASPLRPALGLPIPASPADSGFLPRREFLPSSSKAKSSAFALLSFSNTSSLRLSAFPPSVVGAVRKFFDDRKLLKIYKDNKSPLKDKENIENDRPIDRPEDEFVAELTLIAKYWANAKTVETELLMIQLFVLLNSQGYALLSSIAGREPGDKLTLVFERPVASQSSPHQVQPNNVYTPGHRQSGHGGSTGSAIVNNGVHQLLFGISFTSPTSFRCMNPPLESTPGILQALRNAWPRGVEGESKIADGCFEFKLRGYSFFADDTYQTDFLALTVALLKGLQKLHFTLISSISLSNSHVKNKELWLFASTDTDTLSPQQLLSSISASPIAYTTGTISGSINDGTFPRTYSNDKEKAVGHLRSASVDTAPAAQSSAFNPGHQRNATTPAFGTGAFGSTSTVGTITAGKGPATPRSQGSVLVKKSHGAKGTQKYPENANGTHPDSKAITPPGTTGANTTPPKAPTPPAASASKQMGILPASSSKPIMSSSSSKPQQPQQVLYSTPTSGNVLYSTPPSSPPVSYNHFPAPTSHSAMHPSSPNPNLSVIEASPPGSPTSMQHRPASPSKMGAGRPSNIDIPPNASTARAIDEEGPTPPLLSSSAFRDTVSDRSGEQTAGRDSLFSGTSIMSGKSGESFDVPVMWTGGFGGVGLGTTVEEGEENEDASTFRGTTALPSPNPPGGWVDEPSGPPTSIQRQGITGKASRETTRSTKEKERTVGAKVDGAQLVTVSTPNQEVPQAAIIGTTGGLGDKKGGSSDPSKDKSDGWVMVKVSGDQQALKANTTKPPAGPLRAVNASPGSMSSVETPPAIAPAKSAVAEPNRMSKSGDESSSSHDRSAPPSSNVHSNTASKTGTKSRSGFRKLFGRGDKEKDKVGSPINLESPTKKSRWAKVKADIVPAPAEPARASRRMTIE